MGDAAEMNRVLTLTKVETAGTLELMGAKAGRELTASGMTATVDKAERLKPGTAEPVVRGGVAQMAERAATRKQ